MDDRIVSLLREAKQLKKELDSLRPLDKEREAIVLQKLRLDWNFHSNHLEGNSLTFGETKALILFGITAQGKPLKDHFEITGHDEAIKWVEDIVNQKELLTENFIRQLHTLLLKEPYKVDAITDDGKLTKKTIKVGKYKSTPNHVRTKTGEIFRFATPEETPAKMNDLMLWLRKKEKDKETNPILLAADFHYKFIRIHPFDDGNGRVARILMNFILMQNGYPPVIIKTHEKGEYIAALEQADAGIFEPFIEFIITNEARSLELMLKGARGESIEEPDDLDKELALLELKLRGKSKNNPNKSDEEIILSIVKHSLYPLLNEISIRFKTFDKFYNRLHVSAMASLLDSPSISKDIKLLYNVEYLLTQKPHFKDREQINPLPTVFLLNKEELQIEIECELLGFKIPSIGGNSQELSVTFTFSEKEFTITFFSNKIVKLYGMQLLQGELEEIVNSLKKEAKKSLDKLE
jgi:Fic family protein